MGKNIMGTIGGITGVLCVIFLQFIGFSLGKKTFIVLTSGALILIRGKSAPQVLRFHKGEGGWGVPNLGNASI